MELKWIIGYFDFWVVKLNPTLGVDEVENNSSISIFPNPTNGIFTISSTEEINEVEMFNALGKAVYSKKVTSKNITINLTPFPKGIYLVQIKTNTNSVTKKIVYE
ncbi:MAG: T9SS type A sorting domain-containing protein [Vicingaceae bacterium]|nr:T9SS type A sorting domain-containing protein [Vicingaceae bacterium]